MLFLSFLGGGALATASLCFPRIMATAGLAAFLYLVLKRRSLPVALTLLAGAAVVLLAQGPAGVRERGPGYSNAELEGYFLGPPAKASGGFRQRFRVSSGWEGGELDVLSGREFEVGERRALRARISFPSPRLNPGTTGFGEPAAFLESSEPVGGGPVLTPRTLIGRLRAGLDREISGLLGPEEAALVSAVTTGGVLEGMDGIRKVFRDSGLAHLLSISGTHFGFFGVLVFGLARFGLARLPRIWLERMTERLSPSEAAALLTLPLMLVYLLLSGARVPSQRAFVITGMFLLGLLLGRRGGWLHFLGLAGAVILLMDPSALAGPSFQMSFIAVFFIGMFLRRPERRMDGPEGGLLSALRVLVAVSLAATVGVLPLVAWRFNYASLVSPLANIVVTPLVSMVIVPLALLGALAFLLTGHFITWPLLAPASKAAIWLAGLFASVPHASVPVPGFPLGVLMLYYAGFGLWFFFRDKKHLLLAPAVPVALWAAIALAGWHGSEGKARVTFLDSGQADAAVVEFPDRGGIVVVDTGRSGREVEAFLRQRGIERVDALVLTHGHSDHSGGAERIASGFDLREVWDNGRIGYEPGGILWPVPKRSLSRGDLIEGEGFRILVLHPYPGYESVHDLEGEAVANDRSLVLRLEAGGGSFLMTSDIGEGALEDILRLPRKWLRSDVLKAPHHGLNPRVQEALADAVRPGVIVVPGPREGRGVSAALGFLPGARAYATGRDGAVSVVAGDGVLDATSYAGHLMAERPSLKEEGRNLVRLFTVWPGD